MQREAKRRRTESLQELLHVGGISEMGLQRLMRRIGRVGLESLDVSRRQLIDANAVVWNAHRVVDLMPLASGEGDWSWEYLSPNGWMSALVDRSPALQRMFSAALARSPCTEQRPWSLILGFDEFTPGNKLNVDNARKCMVLSFSFRELGQDV
jgi:hypothetical protein